jgi:hypothetical protein
MLLRTELNVQLLMSSVLDDASFVHYGKFVVRYDYKKMYFSLQRKK